jgi:hypothetical protein
MSRRARGLSYGLAALVVLAGAALAVLVSGTLGQLLGFVLIAIGLVLATSLVFLEVGLSEDRERAREREAREREAEAQAHETPKPPHERRPRVRLRRTRGHPRRLR